MLGAITAVPTLQLGTAPRNTFVGSWVAGQFSLTIRPYTQSLSKKTGESYTLNERSVRTDNSLALSQLLFVFLDPSHNPLPNPFVAAFLESLFQPLNLSPDSRYFPR